MRHRELVIIIHFLEGFGRAYRYVTQYPWEDAYDAGKYLGRMVANDVAHYVSQLEQMKREIKYLQTEILTLREARSNDPSEISKWAQTARDAIAEKKKLTSENNSLTRKLIQIELEKNQELFALMRTAAAFEDHNIELEELTTKQHIELMRLRGDSNPT